MKHALTAAALVLAAQTIVPNRVVETIRPLPEVRQTVQLRGIDEFVVPQGKKFVVKELIQGPGVNSHVEVEINGDMWWLRFDQQIHPAVNVTMYKHVTTFEYGHEFPAGTVIRMHEGNLNMQTGAFTPYEDRYSDVLTGILLPE